MRAFVLLLMVVTSSGAAVSQELADVPKQQARLPTGSTREPPSSYRPMIDCTYGMVCPIVSEAGGLPIWRKMRMLIGMVSPPKKA